jgi:hypothetical protein
MNVDQALKRLAAISSAQTRKTPPTGKAQA